MNKSLQTPIKHTPTMPLTTLQKRWLKSLLLDPRIVLFSPDAGGLEDVQPLFYPDDFVYFDRYQDGDPFGSEDYVRHFRTVLAAINDQRKIYIKQLSGKGREHSGEYIPARLEYSAKDDKFRLFVANGRYSAYINIARVTESRQLERYSQEDIRLPRIHKKCLTFTLTDERNALDRCMLHFSDCRKETRRIDEYIYEVTLWYDPRDETELLIRILQYGPMIKVTQAASCRIRWMNRLWLTNRWMKSSGISSRLRRLLQESSWSIILRRRISQSDSDA